jgi:hypothetical protein
LLQQNGHLALIDTTGTPIPNTPLSPFIDLPAVTGAGAATATPRCWICCKRRLPWQHVLQPPPGWANVGGMFASTTAYGFDCPSNSRWMLGCASQS